MEVSGWKISLPNNSALAEGTRVTLTTGYLAAQDDTHDELGTIEQRVFATDPMATVLLINAPVVRHMIANGAINKYAAVYAAASGKIASTGTLVRGMSMEAASGDGSVIKVLTQLASLVGDVARANLTVDAGAVFAVPLTSMLTHATMVTLGSSAGTPSGDFGLTPGTYGSASPVVIGEAASGNSKSDACRFLFRLPECYKAGGAITLRVYSKITGNVQVAQTIDASAYLTDGAAGVGSDLVTTNAITLTTSFANHDFTITPTSLVAGNILDIQLTGAANDTGGTANKLVQIGGVSMLLDIQG